MLASLIGLYVTSNVLINVIGVPLAAYHSYNAWSDAQGESVDEFVNDSESDTSESVSQKTPADSINNQKESKVSAENKKSHSP